MKNILHQPVTTLCFFPLFEGKMNISFSSLSTTNQCVIHVVFSVACLGSQRLLRDTVVCSMYVKEAIFLHFCPSVFTVQTPKLEMDNNPFDSTYSQSV
jgi:hypothetical protein